MKKILTALAFTLVSTAANAETFWRATISGTVKRGNTYDGIPNNSLFQGIEPGQQFIGYFDFDSFSRFTTLSPLEHVGTFDADGGASGSLQIGDSYVYFTPAPPEEGKITYYAPVGGFGLQYVTASLNIIFDVGLGHSFNPGDEFNITGISDRIALLGGNRGDDHGSVALDMNAISLEEITVPEPAMLGLFGLGVIGLGLSRRRKS